MSRLVIRGALVLPDADTAPRLQDILVEQGDIVALPGHGGPALSTESLRFRIGVVDW